MSAQALSKEHLIQQFATAYEELIQAAERATERGVTRQGDTWGPREVVAHLAGWEVMANVRIPHILNGMPPAEFTDPIQERVMNDAINATIVTMTGDQSLETICGILRRAYQRTVEILSPVDERHFQPGEYIYERTQGVIEHCHEHMEVHLSR
jgi:hypothetical protein